MKCSKERRSVINNGLKGKKQENRLRFKKKKKNTEKEVGDFFLMLFLPISLPLSNYKLAESVN